MCFIAWWSFSISKELHETSLPSWGAQAKSSPASEDDRRNPHLEFLREQFESNKTDDRQQHAQGGLVYRHEDISIKCLPF